MNTQPEYQRRGIASMLMKWGTDKLEEMRWPGIIVSTDQGHGLYVKHGFREVEHWEVDMGQWPQYGGSGMYRKFLLTRFPSEEAA